jgi:SepF-like predicted cell division protein (DUF552 family)
VKVTRLIPFPWGKTKQSKHEAVDVEGYVESLSVGANGMIEQEDVIYVKPINLDAETALDDVTKELKKGNIVILEIGRAISKSSTEAYAKIRGMKKIVNTVGGEIVRVAQTKIMILPEGIEVAYSRKDEEDNE